MCRQPQSIILDAATQLHSLHEAIWEALYDNDSFGRDEFDRCVAVSGALYGVLDQADPVEALDARLAILPAKLRNCRILTGAADKAGRALDAMVS